MILDILNNITMYIIPKILFVKIQKTNGKGLFIPLNLFTFKRMGSSLFYICHNTNCKTYLAKTINFFDNEYKLSLCKLI